MMIVCFFVLLATAIFIFGHEVCPPEFAPADCKPTEVGDDECKEFAPRSKRAATECQLALKGAPSYLKICTFTNGLKKGGRRVAPIPRKCTRVGCTSICYIPCVYFIARNRSFKAEAEPMKEVQLHGEVTYECTSDDKRQFCGCASVAN